MTTDEMKLETEAWQYANQHVDKGAPEAARDFKQTMMNIISGAYVAGFRRGFNSGSVSATKKESPSEKVQ